MNLFRENGVKVLKKFLKPIISGINNTTSSIYYKKLSDDEMILCNLYIIDDEAVKFGFSKKEREKIIFSLSKNKAIVKMIQNNTLKEVFLKQYQRMKEIKKNEKRFVNLVIIKFSNLLATIGGIFPLEELFHRIDEANPQPSNYIELITFFINNLNTIMKDEAFSLKSNNECVTAIKKEMDNLVSNIVLLKKFRIKYPLEDLLASMDTFLEAATSTPQIH